MFRRDQEGMQECLLSSFLTAPTTLLLSPLQPVLDLGGHCHFNKHLMALYPTNRNNLYVLEFVNVFFQGKYY